MSIQFSGKEVVEIGIQIEKNGFDFYMALAKKTKEPKARKVFELLGHEEEKHIEVFESMLPETNEQAAMDQYPGEYYLYLKALADQHVFTSPKAGVAAAADAATTGAALDMALEFEKDSILLFMEFKKTVIEEDQPIIDRLIDQERQHFTRLADIKRNMGKGAASK
jgi:rubrerythrin